MSHVDEGRLHAFLDGALRAEDPADAERVELHLAACADCRARLDEAARLRDEATALLGAAQPRVAATPSFEAIRARAGAIAAREGAPSTTAAPTRRRRAFLATPFNGVAWAATVVLAVGLGWMLRDNLEEGDRVALSEVAGGSLDQSTESTVEESAAVGFDTYDALAPEAGRSSGAALDAWPPAEADAPSRRGYNAMSPPPPAPAAGVAAQAEVRPSAADERIAPADYDVVAEELAVSEAPREPGSGRDIVTGQAANAARVEAARAPAAPPPAAPPPAMADMAGAGAGGAEDGWRPVTLAEAERSTDGGVLRVPGARIERVSMRSGAAEVRTVQITERGETLVLTQRRVLEADARRSRESAMAEAPEEAQTESEKPAAAVRVDDWTVTITGATQARLDELARSLD